MKSSQRSMNIPPLKISKVISYDDYMMYTNLCQCFSHVCGSEYIGNSVRNGSCNKNGIRNEDLTCLSFDNDQFDYILSFDVLEHIPNYMESGDTIPIFSFSYQLFVILKIGLIGFQPFQ